MKTTLQLLLLFFSYCSLAQITLEHTYTDGNVNRIKLEYSGEKYYVLKSASNELVFYNADHSIWKTIVLPASPTNPLAGGARIYHVSEATINPDTQIEVLFSYYNHNTNKFDSRISQEDGTILLTIPDAAEARIDKIEGLSNKLITTNIQSNPISKVYSLSDFTLENTYTDGTIKRVKLENSGEKYYLLDKINQNVKVFNSDHSLWKAIAMPKPTDAKYSEIGIISETQINTDALLEIGYSYYTLEGSIANYVGKLINENNLELLSIPKARILIVNVIEGLEKKLIATLNNASVNTSFSTNIYQIPSLTLEKAYESEVTRVKLENSGEKYYTSYELFSNQAKIYNSNHTLWKTIELPLPSDELYKITTINSLSENKIDSDALVELSYSYVLAGLLEPIYQSRVTNENGKILITVNGINGLFLNEINNLNTKLIGNTYNPYDGGYTSVVCSIGNLKTNAFIHNLQVIISPNPAKSIINISSLVFPIKEVAIYNMVGALVKKEVAQNCTKIDVEKLPKGIYILYISVNDTVESHQVIIE